MSYPLLSVKNIVTEFRAPSLRTWWSSTTHRAVDGVSIDIQPGETFGLVGESGCGKTTLVRSILGLVCSTSGSIHFDGVDLLRGDRRLVRRVRRAIQVIFQDPSGSLNPRLRVGTLVGEPLRLQRLAHGAEAVALVEKAISMVGLPVDVARRFPHELSGGQRQRVGIARAIVSRPRLIICDEPVSALDVSIQSQIINLLVDLQSSLGVAYLFIAHNLAVVRHIARRIAVMQNGRIVELAEANQLFDAPQHPYTATLLAAVPSFEASIRS